METQVVIYREKENEELIYVEGELEKYNELIGELGLSPVKENKCPNVYVILNAAMKKQLHAVCPSSLKIEDYKRGTIPLQVLQALKFAKDNEMFTEYQIWYDDIKPDPLLIGKNPVEGSTWDHNYYLIARWGDEALALQDLLELGFQRIKQKLIDSAQDVQNTCKNILETPDNYVRKFLANKFDTYSPGSRLELE